MHFSIPDTTEVSARKGSQQHSYTLFHIHVNGVHHCSLRYSQLCAFHSELHRLFSKCMAQTQPFPPKKLFHLSAREIDERRLLLERYLQSIVQNRALISSSYFNEFFLHAQHETVVDQSSRNLTTETVTLTIHLLNRYEVTLENVSADASTGQLLDDCAAKLQLDTEHVPFFSLYLYEGDAQQICLIRPLFSFESPCLSLAQVKKSNESVCLVLAKSYWNVSYDLQLLDNRRTRNLLFIQAVYEIEQSKDLYSSDIHRQLDALQETKSLKEYVLFAHTLKFYGYIQLKQCSILCPVHGADTQQLVQCTLAVGKSELICHSMNVNEPPADGAVNREIVFKVTRIRCWKVNWNAQEMNVNFEYLIRKDTLQWITIHTEQAALVSTCLQSMIDEILTKTARPEPSKASRPNVQSGLTTRTKIDLERLNNNALFDRGDGDDDL